MRGGDQKLGKAKKEGKVSGRMIFGGGEIC